MHKGKVCYSEECRGALSLLRSRGLPESVLYLIQHIEAPVPVFWHQGAFAHWVGTLLPLDESVYSSYWENTSDTVRHGAEVQGVEVACQCLVWSNGFHWSHSDNGLQNKDEFTLIEKPFGEGGLFLSLGSRGCEATCSNLQSAPAAFTHIHHVMLIEETEIERSFFSPCKNRWSTCRIITSLVRICLFSNTWASLCDLLDFLLQILYNGPAWKENKGHLGIYCNIVSNCGRLICLEDRQQRGSMVILVIRIDWEFAAHYAASVALISSHGNKICLILHKTFHMLDPMQGGFYYKS